MDIKINLLGWDDLMLPMEAAMVAREHALLISPPGTAKSLFSNQFFANFEGRVFSTQVSKWSDELQLFGMPDMEELKRGNIIYHGKGTLLDCDYAFLDELFDGSDALLRTTLGPLHERVFSRGGKMIKMPLRTCLATSNYARVTNLTEAVLDRFAIQMPAPKLGTADLMKLVTSSRNYETWNHTSTINHGKLDNIASRVDTVSIPDGQANNMVEISVKNLYSPRRVRKIAKLSKTLAAIDDRTETFPQDCQLALIATIPVQNHPQRENIIREINERFSKMGMEGDQLQTLDDILRWKPTKSPKENAVQLVTMVKSLSKISPATDRCRKKLDEVKARMVELRESAMTEANELLKGK